jgi:glycosyltransferase involved in cell wall biosynthesis
MAAAPDVFFDITTSAQWTGRPTGIVRTERELARRAPALLGERLAYCVWSHSESRFYGLSHDIAARVLAGELTIDVNPVAPKPAPVPHPIGLRERLGLRRPPSPAPPPPIPQLHELSTGPFDPGPASTVFSGGLDWDYKDLRAIRAAKKVHGFRYVAVLYDLIALTHPHFVAPANRLRLADYFGELFWTADRLLPISADTEGTARAWCESNRIDMAFSRFEPGSDLPAVPGELPGVLAGTTFALAVGTIEPRKNHRVLYDAWRVAIARGALDPARHRLVFAGSIGWSVDNLIDEIRANPLTRDTIVVLQGASDGDIARLYTDAAACLVPSHHEGYGLPLAEAQRYGALCLASPSGALRESGSDSVVWLNPDDPQAWSHAIPSALAASNRTRTSVQTQSWDEAARAAFTAAGFLA